MKARVMEVPLQIHAQKAVDSPVTAQIPVGEIVELGTTAKAAGTAWVMVTAGAVQGWTLGSSKVSRIKRANLMGDSATIYSAPDEASAQVGTLTKATAFDILRTVSGAGHDWVHIQDTKGREGFIDGRLKVKVQNAGKANKLVGGSAVGVGIIIFTIGLVVTMVTYSNAESTGGTYFLWWGPMLWGAWLVIRGLYDIVTGQTKTTAPPVPSAPSPIPRPAPASSPPRLATAGRTTCRHCGGQTRADLGNCEYCGFPLVGARQA
jgi:hypothetical protein